MLIITISPLHYFSPFLIIVCKFQNCNVIVQLLHQKSLCGVLLPSGYSLNLVPYFKLDFLSSFSCFPFHSYHVSVMQVYFRNYSSANSLCFLIILCLCKYCLLCPDHQFPYYLSFQSTVLQIQVHITFSSKPSMTLSPLLSSVPLTLTVSPLYLSNNICY